MAHKSKTKETERVAGSGNSQYAQLAGEGPVTESSFGTGSESGNEDSEGQAIAQQEAEPTILSHDLKEEGMPTKDSE